MIERFYLKDFLSFKEVELEFDKGLVVFSGPSGSGKSILLESILSSFGLGNCDASLCESSVTWKIDEDGIENDEINVFKQLKKEKIRYFLNNQSISKKNISKIASKHLRHLSLKDFSDFENKNLLDILDNRISLYDKNLEKLKKEYIKNFEKLKKLSQELKTIEDEEKRIVELKEFVTFEIQKIDNISPKIGEYEELFEIKKELSKKEKVLQAIEKAYAVFEYEYIVSEALELLEEDTSFFDDAMNELRTKLESAKERFDALDDVDVEEVLNRLEALSELKRKYGSIEEAIKYREKKAQELKKYENIEIQKEHIEKELKEISKIVQNQSLEISKIRQNELKNFQKDLDNYLKQLYLGNVDVLIKDTQLTKTGKDEIILKLNGVELNKISTGEFNRLRLAVLALKSEFLNQNGGVLMLDEIDANLSGEESMSVAKVLRKLSKKYQIFVISHQPQLTSQGEQHFFVYKESGISKVKELHHEKRIDEIARIISGNNITKEAKMFAQELLKS